jgi:hypothetical protein
MMVIDPLALSPSALAAIASGGIFPWWLRQCSLMFSLRMLAQGFRKWLPKFELRGE